MKRAVLVKMKNGRHRVATSGEISHMGAAKAARIEADNQRARAFSAIARLVNAKEEAANEILRNRYLPDAVDMVVRRLTDEYGPELMRHAEQLRNSSRERSTPWVSLSASFDWKEAEVMKVRGEIPAFRYELAVMDW